MAPVKKYHEHGFTGHVPAIIFSTITYSFIFSGLGTENKSLLWIGYVISSILASVYTTYYLYLTFNTDAWIQDIPLWFRLRFIYPSTVYFSFVTIGMSTLPEDENLLENSVIYRDFIYYWTLTFQLICIMILLWTPDYTMVDDDGKKGPEDTLKEPLLAEKELGVEIV